jgi:hypothetical protein
MSINAPPQTGHALFGEHAISGASSLEEVWSTVLESVFESIVKTPPSEKPRLKLKTHQPWSARIVETSPAILNQARLVSWSDLCVDASSIIRRCIADCHRYVRVAQPV